MDCMPNILKQLMTDKLFVLALLAGLVFWWLNKAFAISPLLDNPSWLFLFLSCLLYPVLEELTFRGVLQGALLRCAWATVTRLGLTQANWVCSFIFALFHLYSQNIIWSAAVFIPSLLFGFFRDKYKSTVPGIILHCIFNTGFFLIR